MSFEVTRKTLWDARRSMIGWAAGLAGATMVYTASYAIIDPSEYADVISTMPPEIVEAFGWGAIATPSGYLGSTVYGLVVPILVTVFAIAFGTRVLAGDEESHRLELTATMPVSRASLLLQRIAATVVAGLGVASVVFAGVFVLKGAVGLEVPILNVAAASAQLGLLAVFFASLAVAVGAATGRRGVVLGSAAAVAVGAYFADTVIPTLEGLAWVENLSVFHYYDGAAALERGFDAGGIAVLVGLAAVLVGLAVFTFDRRDLGTA